MRIVTRTLERGATPRCPPGEPPGRTAVYAGRARLLGSGRSARGRVNDGARRDRPRAQAGPPFSRAMVAGVIA